MKLYRTREYLTNQLKVKTVKLIAEENNVSTKTIHNLKWKYDLTNPRKFWSKRELNLLHQNYSINPDVYRLLTGRTISSINHKAHKLKLKRLQRNGKYKLDNSFFDKWNPKNAYVFGWFCSDGNVSRDLTHCGFHIHKKDKEILEIIKKVMISNHRIEIRGKYAYLRIYNRKISTRLAELGCMPRKSLTLEFPNISDKYLNHFVRGYFDGDGSIHFNKPNTIKIKLVGTKQFLETLQNKLHDRLNLKKHDIKKHHNIFVFEYYGNDARAFCSWIYKNSQGLFLGRKYQRYLNHIKLRDNDERKTSHSDKKRLRYG